MSREVYLKRGGHVRYPPRCKTCEPRPLVGRRLKMLVLLCLIATSPLLQLAAGVSSELYPFGAGSLDSSLGPNDDGSSAPITLLRPFPFFDEDRTTVFVNNNGIVSFARRVSSFTPNSFPLSGDLELIAPYWADVDTRGTGQVWYRETTDPDLIARAGNEIQAAFISMVNFRPTSLFIATWDAVGYFSRHTEMTNTFQCVMATDGTRSFVLFLYENITWTTGDASGGRGGFGGTPAQVGFNAGDGIRFASVPGSQTAEIANIEETSNVGVPGLWIFRVDENIVLAGCSEDPNVGITLAPRVGSVLGGTAVEVEGPCLNETDVITCTFDGTLVPGAYVSEFRAICVSPALRDHGRRRFTLTVNRVDGSLKYSGSAIFYALSVEDHIGVSADYDSPLLLPDTPLTLRWSPEELVRFGDPSATTVNIILYLFDFESGSWSELRRLATDVENDGIEDVILPFISSNTPGQPDEVFPVAFQVSVGEIRELSRRQVDERPPMMNMLRRAAVWGPIVYYSISENLRGLCSEWCDEQPENIGETLLDRLPPCPPTVSRARQDARYSEDTGVRRLLNGVFHSGADNCFRQQTFTRENQGSGQQCCYSTRGNLITGSEVGAGSVDRVAPVGLRGVWGHFLEDVLPAVYCCTGAFSNCAAYHRKRPADDGERYFIRPPACVYGDPHIVTLDGLKYTFNGKGEFVLIETADASFALQGRMVDATDQDGNPAPATVFSAIAARQSDSATVQFEISRRGLDALVDGERVEFEDLPVQTFNNVTVRVEEGRNDSLSASFSSGARVQVRVENGILSVLLVSLPDTFQGRTRGLMGNFNGDTSDDLQPRFGFPVAVNSSIEEIHFQFGVTWIITLPEQSLFTYTTAGESFETFFDPEYLPSFGTVFNDPELQAQAEALCGSDQFCLYDVAATRRTDIGLSTLIGNQEFEVIVELALPIVCAPPCENGACVANNTCSCAAGYEGALCNERIESACDTNPCENGGTCTLFATSYLCDCADGFSGGLCETRDTPEVPMIEDCNCTRDIECNIEGRITEPGSVVLAGSVLKCVIAFPAEDLDLDSYVVDEFTTEFLAAGSLSFLNTLGVLPREQQDFDSCAVEGTDSEQPVLQTTGVADIEVTYLVADGSFATVNIDVETIAEIFPGDDEDGEGGEDGEDGDGVFRIEASILGEENACSLQHLLYWLTTAARISGAVCRQPDAVTDLTVVAFPVACG